VIPSDVTVRKVHARDAEQIAGLLGELGYPTEARDVPARLARLESDARAVALVAERAGEVLGLLTMHRIATLHAAQAVAMLTTLVVTARVRGGGVGRQLVEAAEGEARRHGCARVVVTTALQRADAHAFYERLGYAHTGRRYAKAL
jgi:predicted N-acetyltransferase YhbS